MMLQSLFWIPHRGTCRGVEFIWNAATGFTLLILCCIYRVRRVNLDYKQELNKFP